MGRNSLNLNSPAKPLAPSATVPIPPLDAVESISETLETSQVETTTNDVVLPSLSAATSSEAKRPEQEAPAEVDVAMVEPDIEHVEKQEVSMQVEPIGQTTGAVEGTKENEDQSATREAQEVPAVASVATVVEAVVEGTPPDSVISAPEATPVAATTSALVNNEANNDSAPVDVLPQPPLSSTPQNQLSIESEAATTPSAAAVITTCAAADKDDVNMAPAPSPRPDDVLDPVPSTSILPPEETPSIPPPSDQTSATAPPSLSNSASDSAPSPSVPNTMATAGAEEIAEAEQSDAVATEDKRNHSEELVLDGDGPVTRAGEESAGESVVIVEDDTSPTTGEKGKEVDEVVAETEVIADSATEESAIEDQLATTASTKAPAVTETSETVNLDVDEKAQDSETAVKTVHNGNEDDDEEIDELEEDLSVIAAQGKSPVKRSTSFKAKIPNGNDAAPQAGNAATSTSKVSDSPIKSPSAAAAAPSQAPLTTSPATGPPSWIPFPHHSVVLSSQSSEPNKIVIHRNITDGDATRWPTMLTVGNSVGGARNWYEEVDEDEKRHVGFRKQVGTDLAKLMELSSNGSKSEDWILDELPTDYKYFVHHTGKATGPDRVDPYVYGTTAAAKFRTAREITPHLFWLINNGPGNKISCLCKYCAKTTQAQASKAIGLGDLLPDGRRAVTNPSSKPSPANKKPASDALKKRGRVSVGGEGLVGRSGPGSAKGKGKAVQVDDDGLMEVDEQNDGERGDVEVGEARPSTSTASRKRKARRSDPGPSTKRTGNGSDESKKIKKPKKSQAKAMVDPRELSPSFFGTFYDQIRDEELTENARYRKNELVWCRLKNPLRDEVAGFEIDLWPAVIMARVVQNISKATTAPDGSRSVKSTPAWGYQVRLLALADEITRPETQIMPWLLYSPPAEFTMQERFEAPEAVAHVWDGTKCLRPALETLGTAAEGATAFALAIQIASHISQSFSLGGKFTAKTTHAKPLEDGTPIDENSRDDFISKWQFSYVYWGAEKIWVEELIRLNVDNDAVLPGIREASSLPLFLKIESIYQDHHQHVDDNVVTVNLAGIIYELVEATDPRLARVREDESLPSPPAGHLAFLRHGEANTHIPLDYTAGRLYEIPPRLQTREAIAMAVQEDETIDRNHPATATFLSRDMRFLSLAGIVEANRLYMICSGHHQDRTYTLKTAESTANKEMTRHFRGLEQGMVDEPEEDAVPAEVEADVE